MRKISRRHHHCHADATFGARLMPQRLNISPGETFGRWTVISEGTPLVDKRGYKVRTIRCKCDCQRNVVRDVRLGNLASGKSISCGCLKDEKTVARSTNHGKCYHPLYKIWEIIKYRCSNPKSQTYHSYNTLDISVCDEWKDDFEAFFDWSIENGWKPGLQIDREENLKGYSPDNCRFVTPRTNSQNKRTNRLVSYHGESICVTELARRHGLNHKTLCNRLDRGVPVEQALLKASLERDPATGQWVSITEETNT